MGKRNVVLYDGTVVVATEEQLAALQGGREQTVRYQQAGEQMAGMVAETNEAETSGVRAFAEGAADSATFGLYGAANEAITGGHRMRATGEANQGARLAGEVAGIFTPGGAGSLAAKMGTGIASRVAGRAGVATVAQAARGVAVGRAAEGAALGVGGYVAKSNISGDPLTIAGAVEAAGIGGLLNVGVGAALDKLGGIGKRAASTPVTKAVAEADDVAKAASGVKVWKDPPPSWTEFTTAHKEATKSTETFNREVAKQAEDYAKATSDDALHGIANKIEVAKNKTLSKINKSDFGKATKNATTDNDKTLKAYREFASSSEDMPKWLQKADSQVNKIPRRYGPAPDDAFSIAVARAADAAEAAGTKANKATIKSVFDNMDPLLRGKSIEEFETALMTAHTEGRLALGADFGKKKMEYVYRTNGKPPISEAVKQEVKELRAMLSDVGKLRGGFKPNGTGHWSKQGGPELDAMMDSAYKVRDRMWKYSRFDLKDLPARPSMATPEATAEIAALREQAKRLESATLSARTAIKEKRVDDAIAEFRKLKEEMPELDVPTLPAPAGTTQRTIFKVELPKDPRAFARMTEQRVNDMATELAEATARGENGVAEAYSRWMKDVGFEQTGNIAEDIVGAHRQLADSWKAYERVQASSAITEAVEKKSVVGWLRRAAKGAASSALGYMTFGALGGGMIGAGGASAARTVVRTAMDKTDDALLAGTLQANKIGIREKVRELVTVKGAATSAKLKKLGPVNSVLSSRLSGGEPDTEKDIRKMTVGRINDVLHASVTAPDTMFTALQPMMGQAGDIAYKMHAQVVGALQHLAMVAPKDPGLDTTMFGSEWLPNWTESIEFAHRYEAVMDPLKAISRFFAGDGHPAAADTLWTVWGPVLNEVAQEMSMQPDSLKGLTYAQQSGYAELFGAETGLKCTPIGLGIQGLYLPRPEEAGGSSQPSNPGGRPPAVKSSVAGSSVSGLISQ
jgi:hypothetical protein